MGGMQGAAFTPATTKTTPETEASSTLDLLTVGEMVVAAGEISSSREEVYKLEVLELGGEGGGELGGSGAPLAHLARNL